MSEPGASGKQIGSITPHQPSRIGECGAEQAFDEFTGIGGELQQALDLLERHLERLGPRAAPEPAPITSSAVVTSAAILSELRSVAHMKATPLGSTLGGDRVAIRVAPRRGPVFM